ncbi:SLC13 family permease [Psychromonas antarctica]|uniref:SLC13 family permease n=1 Tax=Psychromonas antarctica TaxID=67573 RepID=UPI001EE87417|nr:DASS family sodium-coupled anion symporter [Psychromonas antarctica]MCG6202571.1 DASS family sodium-coupled anion symporter [Psychromonas antarctica]
MGSNVVKILIAIMCASLFYFFAHFWLLSEQAIALGLISFLVILWSNSALPLGVVSLFPIFLFPMFDLMPTDQVSSNYSKSIIFLFIGGFLLAIGVEKTDLHKVIANKILHIFPHTVRGMIYALALTAGCLSAFLSNTTSCLLLMPLVLFLSNDNALKKRFALALCYGASIGGIITPIGTPPNLILYGIIENLKLPAIPFAQWVMLLLPLALIMFLILGWLLSLGTKDKQLDKRHQRIKNSLTIEQKKVTIILLSLIVLLFANSPIQPYYAGLGLNEKGLLLSAGLLLFLPPINILNWKDMKKVPFDIILLFGAGFSIAALFTSSGLANQVAQFLQNFSQLPTPLLIILIASLVTFSTEITSNTALISMILPVIYELSAQNGLDTRLLMMVATICASYAFMLPIATPPNAIAMSSGAVKVGCMMKYGILLNIIGILLVSLFAYGYWRYFIT